MELVFATNNQNKVKELTKLLPAHLKILSLKDIGCMEDIAETEDTIAGNAKLKAAHVKNNYGYDCFADDTGLMVDALNGAPGVYSARYAGEKADAEQNMQKLLNELNGIEYRKAQFKTVISLKLGEKDYLFEGICKGNILYKKQGIKGFGYDPIFQPLGYIRSFAEMDLAKKNKISHRALATKKLVAFLNTLKH